MLSEEPAFWVPLEPVKLEEEEFRFLFELSVKFQVEVLTSDLTVIQMQDCFVVTQACTEMEELLSSDRFPPQLLLCYPSILQVIFFMIPLSIFRECWVHYIVKEITEFTLYHCLHSGLPNY